MKLIGANPQPRMIGLDEMSGKSNYFLGDNPRRWRTNIANYARVEYDEVYPGVDLIWHGNQKQLEHDFIIAPGANPQRIRLSFAGAQSIRIDERGELVLETAAGEIRLLKPQAWQETNGERRAVFCDYEINGKNHIGFSLGEYDRSRELVIDPVLLYSSYIGGAGADQAFGVAVDKDFNAYIVGQTSSPDFPGASPIQPTLTGGLDAFVLKINPSGNGVVYGTWLGGTSVESARSVVVDADGNAYVAGQTQSLDFPRTTGAAQQSNGGSSDGFIAKLNASGSALLYSSYIGGDGGESVSGVAIDGAGNAYLSGATQSTNLPASGIQAGRNSQGLHKSENRAGNWSQIGSGLSVTQVLTVAVDPSNSSVLYAGTPLGVYKSVNGGHQWKLTGQANPATAPIIGNAIVVHPSNPNIIYVGSQAGGIFRSEDAGQSYQTSAGIFNSVDIAIDPVTPATIYAASTQGAFKSVNGGINWTPINNGLSPPFGGQPPRVNRLAIDPSTPSTVYAATSIGVFKTVNGGGAWALASNGLGQGASQVDVLALAIDPSAPMTLYAGLNGFLGALFKTTDGGATWRASNTGLNFPGTTTLQNVQSLAIDPSAPATLYAGTSSGGVYKTENSGATWGASNTGLPNPVINRVIIDRSNPAIVYACVTAGSDAFVAKMNASGSMFVWMTYLGGADSDDARSIAVDKDNAAYITGATSSLNFPTAAPFQASSGGGSDAFVTKINPMGSSLVFSTYFGGISADTGQGIAVNDAGQAIIVGTTLSPNLPSKNPLQPSIGGSNDAFVTKFNAAGSGLEYSTWLGGTNVENGLAVAVDGAGNAHVTGITNSVNFPLADAPQTQARGVDAFVTKLNPSGSALVYSTYLGGAGTEMGNAIAVSSAGDAYIVGATGSPDFPLVNPLRSSLGGGADAFITKLGVETDLAISKAVSRNPVLVNNNFNFTLTVSDNGPSSATGVTVIDQLPAGTTLVSAISSQGSCANNGGTVRCNIGNLAAQGRATITLTVTPTVANVITNTATVAGNERDGNQSNNQASAQVTISNQPSIHGRVALPNNNPLPGVTLNLTGAHTDSRQSDTQGVYQFGNLQSGGNYTVTPSANNFSFEPASRAFNPLNADQEANFVATQCAYALAPTNQTFDAAGGTGAITVIAPPRCPWTATPGASWIRITSGASGAGNGSVTFSVDPATAPRSGRIAIADQNFVVWQGVNVCDDLRFRSKGFRVFGSPTGVEAADLNGDGLSDLLVTRFGVEFDQTLQRSVFPLDIFYSSAGGQFSRGPRLFTPGFIDAQIRYAVVADFNRDGFQDIVSGPVVNGEARLFTARNANEFNESVNVPMRPLNSFDFPDRAMAADLNKDGKIDLIGITDGRILVSLNTSTNNIASFATPFAVSYGGQTFRALTDVNGDGVPDLVTSQTLSPTEQLFQVYPGDGFGSFGQSINSTVPLRTTLTDFGDFNGDARQDVVALAIFSTPQGDRAKMTILYGDGAGRFGSPATFDQFETNPFGQQTRLLARDMNNDARPDALLLSEGRLRLFTTDATGRFASIRELAQISNDNGDLAVGNFDADGKPDFVSVDMQRSSFFVFSNRCGESGLAIYGQTLDRNMPIGFGNVTVRLSGAMNATTTTDLGGNYEFSGLSPGDYVVQVERVLTEFNPSSRTLNNLTTDQVVNFLGERKSAIVSAASFAGPPLAPDSIAAIFGREMGSNTEAAQSRPLPIALANHRVDLRDSSGAEFSTQLFFFSPNQINFLIPAGAANGPASYRIFSLTGGQEPDTTGALTIERVAPGLFTANSDGAGPPAAVALRVKPDDARSFESVAQFDGVKFVPAPIDLGPQGDQVFLLLFGTGIRNNGGLTGVSATIGSAPCEVRFAGAQGGFEGLDQINLLLPRSLAGLGEADLILTVDGKRANAVRVNIK